MTWLAKQFQSWRRRRAEKRHLWRDSSTPESRRLDAQRRQIALARVIEGMRK